MYRLTLELSEQQLSALLAALEMHARIGICHFEYLAEQADKIAHATRKGGIEYDYTNSVFLALAERLQAVKLSFGWGHHAHAGISCYNVSDEVKRAYELLRVIERASACARQFDTPQALLGVPLPIAKLEVAGNPLFKTQG